MGYQLLKVLLQKMHSSRFGSFFSFNIHLFTLPSIYLVKLQQYLIAEIINLQMENERIIIREEIKQPPPIYGDISITVEEPIKNQSETFAFFTYNVTGFDMEGSFSVRRRYKDFDLLRRRLAQRWQGIYIPPISGKRSESNFMHVFKMFGGNDQKAEIKYAETRKRFLRYFCQGIAIRPYLYYCDLFQMFLRGGPDYQIAIQGCLDKEYSFILQEYENNFRSIVQMTAQMDPSAILALNQDHLKQLRQGEDNLNHIYEAIYKNIHARDEFNQQFNICMQTILPQYEQKFFLNHIGNDRKKLILNKSEEFNLKLAQYKTISEVNPIELFLQLVAYEIRQTKAFIQAIEGRKSAERKKYDLKQKIDSKQREINNLANGGFSLRSIFKAGSKELQIKQMEMKLQILKNELYCLEKMIAIMVINTNYEIEQYKLRRGKQYSELFKTVSEKELAQLSLYTQLLGLSLKGEN